MSTQLSSVIEGNKASLDKSEGCAMLCLYRQKEACCKALWIQLWLNQDPTAPFTCPLLWIPTPFGMSEGGNPTAIGGGAGGYSPCECWRAWGLTRGLPAGLPLRCWMAWICLSPSSWIRANVSSSFIDSASKPAPYRGACRDISSWSEASRVWIYCCKRATENNVYQKILLLGLRITKAHTDGTIRECKGRWMT